jgi:hypothetical protein
MSSSTGRFPTAVRGPLTFRVTSDGQPVSNDAFFDGFPAWARDTSRVEKMVARFSIEIAGEPIVTNAPYFYGSADRADELADASDVAESIIDDLRSIEPYIGGEDDMIAWAGWAGDRDLFSDGNAQDVRESIRSWQTIVSWRTLILERIDAGTYSDLLEQDA